jgi:hypothetical protein
MDFNNFCIGKRISSGCETVNASVDAVSSQYVTPLTIGRVQAGDSGCSWHDTLISTAEYDTVWSTPWKYKLWRMLSASAPIAVQSGTLSECAGSG